MSAAAPAAPPVPHSMVPPRTVSPPPTAGRRATDLVSVPSMRSTVIAGLIGFLVLIVAPVVWACLARLDSAAVAPGTVIVDSHRKTVQHLEGGILRELLVREGQEVKAGQPLLRLDSIQADAAVGQIGTQLWSARARLVRLRAEQEGQRKLAWPEELLAQRVNQPIADAMRSQEKLLEARWQAYDSTVEVARRRIDQFKAEIASSAALATGTRDRLRYTREEMAAVESLLEKGYERRPRLLELQRLVAELVGREGELAGAISRSRQSIAASEAEIAGLDNSRQSEIAKEMQDTLAVESEMRERLRANADVQQRREVVAPQEGVVVDIRMYTPGGVITPGQPIMDIVPKNDDMIVEARVNPLDIDTVRVDLEAQIHLSAYKSRDVPSLLGRVIYVSADKMTDQKTGEPYFTARVKLDREDMKKFPQVALYPGMPTEVFIVTGERSAISYMIAPLVDSFRRAFRED